MWVTAKAPSYSLSPLKQLTHHSRERSRMLWRLRIFELGVGQNVSISTQSPAAIEVMDLRCWCKDCPMAFRSIIQARPGLVRMMVGVRQDRWHQGSKILVMDSS